MPARIHQVDWDEDTTYLREALRLLVQSFIELEVSAYIEANPYERSDSRRTQRNGYRQRSWRTRLGEITLFIPKLRKGTYYPAFLDSLHQYEPVLLDLAHDAAARPVEGRDFERLAYRLGMSPIHASQFAEIEERLHDLAQRHKLRQLDIIDSVSAPILLLYMADDLMGIGEGQSQSVPGQLDMCLLAA